MYGIPIIKIEKYKELYADCHIILTLNEKNAEDVSRFLLEEGITDYSIFENPEQYDIDKNNDKRERIISFCADQLEDVILYHVFRQHEQIFYIDVGSNDPMLDNVTRIFYERKNGRGINIDPLQHFINISNKERPRDINICTAVGKCKGEGTFYVQGNQEGLSTFCKEYVVKDSPNETMLATEITTLKEICDENINHGETIHFLKVDVEGFEKEVLEGMDFDKYRPCVVVMEATKPCTYIPVYHEWEPILLKQGYHYAYTYGINRYYVSDEMSHLDKRFIPMKDLLTTYKIFSIYDCRS